MSRDNKNARLIGAGGKRPKTRTNTADNLFSRDRVELILALGEGPIEGLATPRNMTALPPGTPDFRNYFVGDVPLKKADNTDNFSDFQGVLHTGQGFPSGVSLQLSSGVARSVDVGQNCFKVAPLMRRTPPELRGSIVSVDIRIAVTQLYIENSSGTFNNTLRFKIEFKRASQPDITYQPLDFTHPANAPYHDNVNQCLKVTGKTTGGWVHDFRIIFPANPALDDWEIRVTKINEDYFDTGSSTKDLAEFTWESFQVVTSKLPIHQDLAMLELRGRSDEQFNSIPEFYGIFKGLILSVPENYNPNQIGTAAFSPSVWSGVFKQSWTNNPAWILYALYDNPRWGMRAHSPNLEINVSDFYRAGLYCNEAVLTQMGLPQKRYTLNLVLQENMSAREVLENIAGAFDAVTFEDGHGRVSLRTDTWVEPALLFTPECVTPEGFQYSETDLNSRFNDITVSFQNEELNFVEDRRNIRDEEAVARDGRIPLDFVAVGCTNADEAYRRALKRLLTAQLEKKLLSFGTARLGYILDPYEIIWVSDPMMGWGLWTGRIEAIRGRVLQLRDQVQLTPGAYYKVRVQSYLGPIDITAKLSSDGYRLTATSTTPEDVIANFPPLAQFCIWDAEHQPRPFRVLAVEEAEPESDLLNISCSEVSPDRFNHPLLVVTNNRVVYIQEDSFNLNLYSLYVSLHGVPAAGDIVEFRFSSGILISSVDVNLPAVDTGVWPAGVTPKLIIGGATIAGRGGKGGKGGRAFFADSYGAQYLRYYGWSSTSTHPDRYGKNGGLGLQVRSPVILDVSTAGSYISGGGGGGAGGGGVITTQIVGNGSDRSVSGSAGGGGWPYGEAGEIGEFSNTAIGMSGGSIGLSYSGAAGDAGTRDLPGAGGIQIVEPAGIFYNGAGGRGGLRTGTGDGQGSPQAPRSTSGWPSTKGSAGIAGKLGPAIKGNGFITLVGPTNRIRGSRLA